VAFIEVDPAAELTVTVRRVTIVPYGDDVGGVVLYRDGDRLRLPAGPVREGEDPLLDTVLRLPLEQAGFRRQETYAFARADDHLAVWCHGNRYQGARPHARPAWWSGEAAEAARRLAEQGDEVEAALVVRGQAARAALTDAVWYSANRRLLERAYLRGTTAQEGSGFSGSAAEWRAARSPLVDAVTASGSFLDVGCANGLLMASVVDWCAEKGLQVEPYGVDYSEALIGAARGRYPRWADRLWVGNAIDWVPPAGRRFDVVHTLLDAVPEPSRRRLVDHLLEAAVAPGGKLLASNYVADEDRPRHAAAILRSLGFTVAGETRAAVRGGYVAAPSAWVAR
jgi:2-polyprenyl-3-methyl-5-hydroxy-6-metoxy-1,4-benzoquinol methylase